MKGARQPPPLRFLLSMLPFQGDGLIRTPVLKERSSTETYTHLPKGGFSPLSFPAFSCQFWEGRLLFLRPQSFSQ